MKKKISVSFLALMLSWGAYAAEDRVMTVEHLQDASSYFRIDILDETVLNGSYKGWCADWDKPIQDNTPFSYKFYSSYSDRIPAGLIAKPENLDEMNWIINKDFVGKSAGEELGVYTSGDVQLAIWTLIDDDFDTSTVGEFSQARVDRIVELAHLYGNNFYPTCKQEIGIIIDPGTPQSTIIEVKIKKFPKCAVPEGDVEI